MKKIYIIIGILIIGISIFMNNLNNQTTINLEYLKNSFKNIDNNNSDLSVINKVIKDLVYLLNSDDNINDYEINKLSKNLRIFNNTKVKLIQYKLDPALYGNSSKSSWLILKYNKFTNIIQREVPYSLESFNILSIDSVDYLYIFSYNFEFNIQGIVASRYNLGELSKGENAINCISLPDNLKCEFGTLYDTRNLNLIFDDVSNDLNNMQLKYYKEKNINKNTICFKLNEKGLYDFIGEN